LGRQQGHVYTVEGHNDNPTCSVYNRVEYVYYYGKELWWYHKAKYPGSRDYKSFEFNKKIPVLVGVKTQDFIPEEFFKSYQFWTHPGQTKDLVVNLFAKPIPTKDLTVGILAHSHYLQYSEDVDVEIYCKDLDGNEITYTWVFSTEEEPE
jgi:hypothetical protein